MDREKLISEIKDEYAHLASHESQQHFEQTAGNETPEQYYERLLNMVLSEVSKGTFDSFSSGHSVMEAVAKDKHKWLPQWNSHKGGY